MADNIPEASVNSELISAGLNPSNPSMTTVDFANSMSRARQEQQLQEQAIARAKELTKQSQIETRQAVGAEAAGLNPLLVDTMSPMEAVAYLKIILKEKGLDLDEDAIKEWAKTLPARVNRQVVETFANRFARESTRSGQPAKFEKKDKVAIPTGSTAEDLGLIVDAEDSKFGHVPEDGMYQVVYDNQGNIKKFIPGGKEAPDQSAKLALKESESTEKQWQKLDKEINYAFRTRTGGLGVLSTAIFRSVRAINTLTDNPNLTAQDLANVSQDIASIFQGGSPTVVASKENDYRTIFTELSDEFRKYTGVLPNISRMFGGTTNPLEQTKQKLLQVLVDLRDSSIDGVKKYVESEMPAYQPLIDANPDRWQDMYHKKLDFIESGLLVPPGANTRLNITGMNKANESKDPKGKAEKGSKKVPHYEVEK